MNIHFFQDLKKVNNEIELLISQMREEVDMRISLMQVNKMLVLVLTITKSIRNISGIVGESTKWITKIAKKMAGLGPVRCPVCYTDIRNIVTEINEDQDQKNNYMRECLDRNKKERSYNHRAIQRGKGRSRFDDICHGSVGV